MNGHYTLGFNMFIFWSLRRKFELLRHRTSPVRLSCNISFTVAFLDELSEKRLYYLPPHQQHYFEKFEYCVTVPLRLASYGTEIISFV